MRFRKSTKFAGIPANESKVSQEFAGTRSAKEEFRSKNHMTKILQIGCQSDENTKPDFSQCLDRVKQKCQGGDNELGRPGCPPGGVKPSSPRTASDANVADIPALMRDKALAESRLRSL